MTYYIIKREKGTGSFSDPLRTEYWTARGWLSASSSAVLDEPVKAYRRRGTAEKIAFKHAQASLWNITLEKRD